MAGYRHYDRMESTSRVCDVSNWLLVQRPNGPRWFYVQDPSCTILLNVERVFWDYQLLNCDWHAVVFGHWSLLMPGLQRALGKAYIKWSEEMLASDTEEDEEKEGYEEKDGYEGELEEEQVNENLPPAVYRLFLPKNLFSDEE